MDVREELRQGRPPFSRIMQAVADLKDGEDLLLIAPFPPTPLYEVLAREGFSHAVGTTGTGDWEVLFTRDAGATETPCDLPASSQSPCSGGARVVDVDARGLEPPEPLVKILEATADLSEGAEIRAHTDRRPLHLYARLEERGFQHETKEQSDGSFITRIW